MHEMNLSHRQAFELLQRSIDGPLDAGERSELESHLASCAECQTNAALGGQLEEQALAHRPKALPSRKEIERTIRKTQKHHRRWRMINRLFISPVRTVVSAAVAVALVVAVIWIFDMVRQQNQTGPSEVSLVEEETIVEQVEVIAVTHVHKKLSQVAFAPKLFKTETHQTWNAIDIPCHGTRYPSPASG